MFEEWFKNKIDKKKYLELAKNDKKRFEIQVNEFETHGYYSKFYEEDNDFSSSCIFSSSSSSYTESENGRERKRRFHTSCRCNGGNGAGYISWGKDI